MPGRGREQGGDDLATIAQAVVERRGHQVVEQARTAVLGRDRHAGDPVGGDLRAVEPGVVLAADDLGDELSPSKRAPVCRPVGVVGRVGVREPAGNWPNASWPRAASAAESSARAAVVGFVHPATSTTRASAVMLSSGLLVSTVSM
jgi:hypothetical protein